MPTTSDSLAKAVEHHQGGDLRSAEEIYRQILQEDPKQPDVIHLLGVLAYQVGKNELAIAYMERAIDLQGNEPTFHNNLADAYRAVQKLPEALASCRRALELRPDYALAYYNLANLCNDQKSPQEAVTNYQRALALNPNFIEAHNNLGVTYEYLGKIGDAIASLQRALTLRPDYIDAQNNLAHILHAHGYQDEAMAAYQRLIELKPDHPDAHINFGNLHQEKRNLNEAKACYERALELQPNSADANNNLGVVLHKLGRLDEAQSCYLRAVALTPTYAAAYNNLGNTLHELGQTDRAIACLQQALELQPNSAETHNNLGIAFKDQGQLAEAADCFRKAVAVQPRADIHSNLLLCLVYDPTVSQQAIYQEHLRWAELYGRSPSAWRPHTNVGNRHRRLRIGYVSNDFRRHVMAYFIAPILRCHDRNQFEVFCYADNLQGDEFTAQLQQYTDHWRSVARLNDDAMEQTIRGDQIDVLVDLSGHTAGNRLTVFARKPAPLQITWMGYPTTTGLSAIDYRFSDDILHPSEEFSYHVEQLYRLPCGSACFAPQNGCPDVVELPAIAHGFLTFASPHNLAKLNDEVIRLWCQILHAIPTAKLALFRNSLNGHAAQRVVERFARHGVSEERLELSTVSAAQSGYQAYLSKYGEVDIALDTFPGNAGATGFESLFMGVPWLTLYGDRFFGRQTASVLVRLGLTDWVAHSQTELIDKAIFWSNHLEQLAALRAGLRRKFLESTVGDAVRYTRGLEAAYRDIWRRWCEKTSRNDGLISNI